MCSRYELDATPRQLVRVFALESEPTIPNQADVRPTDLGLIITPQMTGELKSWGIPAPWDGMPIFNARAETLSEKPTFRPFLSNRCIVPATAFPEWRKDGKHRFKYRVSILNDRTPEPVIMAFAGLFDVSRFTVITCPAAPGMSDVHARMPVILPPDAIATWLNTEIDFQAACSVLAPYTEPDLSVVEDFRPSDVHPDLFA